MSALPRVTALTRERVARQFDHSGPDACMAEITADLMQENPELLDMIIKCASDLGNRPKVTQGLGMFYRLMVAQSWADIGRSLPNLLPRVRPSTRDLIVRQIDEQGVETFTMQCIEDLEKTTRNFCKRRITLPRRIVTTLAACRGLRCSTNLSLFNHSMIAIIFSKGND